MSWTGFGDIAGQVVELRRKLGAGEHDLEFGHLTSTVRPEPIGHICILHRIRSDHRKLRTATQSEAYSQLQLSLPSFRTWFVATPPAHQ